MPAAWIYQNGQPVGFVEGDEVLSLNAELSAILQAALREGAPRMIEGGTSRDEDAKVDAVEVVSKSDPEFAETLMVWLEASGYELGGEPQYGDVLLPPSLAHRPDAMEIWATAYQQAAPTTDRKSARSLAWKALHDEMGEVETEVDLFGVLETGDGTEPAEEEPPVKMRVIKQTEWPAGAIPIAALGEVMAMMEEQVERLVRKLLDGGIAPSTFRRGMAELIEQFHPIVWEAVAAGETLTLEQEQILASLVQEELVFLVGFESDLDTERMTIGEISPAAGARARQYVAHLNYVWQKATLATEPDIAEIVGPEEAEQARIEGTPYQWLYDWELNPPAEHCKTCLEMSAKGPWTAKQLDRLNIFPGHNTDCRANCQCQLQRIRKVWREESILEL